MMSTGGKGGGEERRKVRVAIAGVGNCASALLQGIEYYRERAPRADEAWGLMHLEMGGYLPGDVEVVAAFDVDRRKVGRPLHEAALAPPNCTTAIRYHGRQIGAAGKLDWRLFANGHLAELLYERGMLDQSLPLQDLLENSNITDKAKQQPNRSPSSASR